jgi:hypothetical protein
MSEPKNPNSIVIKNKYYPNGLKEIDIWNYYQKVKFKILDKVRNRNIAFGISTDINKFILRRKNKYGLIKLTPNNYDELITGRTVVIYSEMNKYEKIGIIDIDITDYDGFNWAKKATLDVYDFVMEKMQIVKSATIKFTGKTSFHIICEFYKKMDIDTIRFLLKKFLLQSNLSKVYTIEQKRTSGIPNLDLSVNKIKGLFITENSLSILGLKSIEVPFLNLNKFTLNKAKI